MRNYGNVKAMTDNEKGGSHEVNCTSYCSIEGTLHSLCTRQCPLSASVCRRERERETRQRLKLREKGRDGFYAFGGWALHSLLSSSRVGQLYCSTSRPLLALPLPYFSLWNGDQDDQKIFQLSMISDYVIVCRCKVWFYPLPLSLQTQTLSTLPCLL